MDPATHWQDVMALGFAVLCAAYLLLRLIGRPMRSKAKCGGCPACPAGEDGPSGEFFIPRASLSISPAAGKHPAGAGDVPRNGATGRS